ncbi:MAG: polyprenol monophosphomannose synthase [Pirellulales bacterium]
MSAALDPRRTVAGPRVLVMTATYNELDNLPDLTDAVFEHLPTAEFLVVDDDSPDGTGVWVGERALRDERVHLLSRSGKQGLGTAIVAGMRWAIDRDYDYVINIDADFSHDPSYLPALVAGMSPVGAAPRDVMIGSRYIAGGGVRGWPWHRRLMSRCVNVYARGLLGLTAQDCSGGFRCYRVETLRRLDLGEVRSRGYSFQEEILWMLKQVGARIGETPITFVDRERGVSKIDSSEAWDALRIIARLGFLGAESPPFRTCSRVAPRVSSGHSPARSAGTFSYFRGWRHVVASLGFRPAVRNSRLFNGRFGIRAKGRTGNRHEDLERRRRLRRRQVVVCAQQSQKQRRRRRTATLARRLHH